MTLYDLWQVLNDSVTVTIFQYGTFDEIGVFEKEDIPEEYEDCLITDVFADDGNICIEIETEE